MNQNPIGMNRLEGFYWVARTEGYTRAAKAFPYPVSEPAVHQQVRKLEMELGTKLFERVAKDRVSLTPAGKTLFAFASPFFDRLPEIVRSIREGHHGGVLRIHAEPLLVRQMLPAWVHRIHRQRPDFRVELREINSANPGALKSGETDLLVGYLPEIPEGIDTRRIGTLRAFWVFPASRSKNTQEQFQISKLAQQTFIAYSSDLLAHNLQLRALSIHGITPNRVITAGSADAILGFVESGLGYSLIPSLSKKGPRIPAVVVRPLKSAEANFPVFAAWRKRETLPPTLLTALATAPNLIKQ